MNKIIIILIYKSSTLHKTTISYPSLHSLYTIKVIHIQCKSQKDLCTPTPPRFQPASDLICRYWQGMRICSLQPFRSPLCTGPYEECATEHTLCSRGRTQGMWEHEAFWSGPKHRSKDPPFCLTRQGLFGDTEMKRGWILTNWKIVWCSVWYSVFLQSM